MIVHLNGGLGWRKKHQDVVQYFEGKVKVSQIDKNIMEDVEIIIICNRENETYTEKYLKLWLSQYQPNGNIWGMNKWGMISMLRRLEEETRITCNPHVFRRTFACLLRRAGVDTMTIKELGRWESLEMVERYTRSFDFNDSLKFYKGPLSC